eukprot:CAMPEP_0197636204 /NCGR_PEP_ID=MMETSP1338-20131121/11785_1 /TAXON_ID=43686 ORGANISM="Pelagodinium beii, Strain RCC1491" /NCGR_SAMPLE_ID=MMETSP1338 /ASSEMBLY_ACC=CAM_ASM_000754 /LENGTH=395 /DNA_ID=CAMNT_0043208395 /DNA_START=450 /DNA_END=1636 /DNA_ORIENTATION=-
MGAKHGVDADLILLGHNTDLLLADYGKPYDAGMRWSTASTDASSSFLSAGSDETIYVSVQGMNPEWPDKGNPSRKMLEHRSGSYILFGMGDFPIGSAEHLENPHLAAMYTNNRKISHPKLFTYPRGVSDTSRWKNALNGSDKQIKRERSNLLMCGCMGLQYGRSEKIQILQRNGFPCECNKSTFVENMLNAKFVMSPNGNGRSCHRHNEAWLAGAIPVVDRDELADDLYATELPLIQVSDWSTVTPQFLEAEWKKMQGKEYDLRKASSHTGCRNSSKEELGATKNHTECKASPAPANTKTNNSKRSEAAQDDRPTDVRTTAGKQNALESLIWQFGSPFLARFVVARACDPVQQHQQEIIIVSVIEFSHAQLLDYKKYAQLAGRTDPNHAKEQNRK